ncbi:sugar ABC transporter substrate-binding protein [Halarchaeum acidiphilum]|nr:sugar ABC transporter substrate-binding protein [Halarchaeum acidiphilum]
MPENDRRSFLKASGIVGTAALTGLAGCGGNGGGQSSTSSSSSQSSSSGGSGQTDVKPFGMVTTLQNDQWQAFANGVQEAANALGAPDSDYKQNQGQQQKMVSQLSTAFTKGYNAICGTPYQASGVPTVVRKCKQNDAGFVDFWNIAKWYTPLDAGENFIQYQIPAVAKTGQLTAEILFEEMGGEGNFVHITGPHGVTGRNRNIGVENAMKKYPDINKLGMQPGDWSRPSGRKVMSSFVSKYGDKIDGVYCQNDAMGLGAYTILKNNDMSVPMVGYDGPKDAVNNIKSTSADGDGPNWVASFSAKTFWQGGYAVVEAFDWLNGWRPTVPERMMWGGGVVVTSDPSKYRGKLKTEFDASWSKPDDYLSVAYSDGKSPYDWKKMSRTLNPDGWDPQNKLVPIRKDEFNQLNWTESNKPSGYSLPDAYSESGTFDDVEQRYAKHHETDPYQ